MAAEKLTYTHPLFMNSCNDQVGRFESYNPISPFLLLCVLQLYYAAEFSASIVSAPGNWGPQVHTWDRRCESADARNLTADAIQVSLATVGVIDLLSSGLLEIARFLHRVERPQGTISQGQSHEDFSNPLAMQLTHGQPYKGKRLFLQCEYCNMKGHSKENCYKLVGNPPDFKSKRNSKSSFGGSGSQVNYGGQTGYGKQPFNAVNNVTGNVDMPPPEMHYRNSGPTEVKAQYFTEEQYKQILNLLSKDVGEDQSNEANHINVAGNAICMMSKVTSDDELIVDSGATHHVASKKSLINSDHSQPISGNSKVHLPTGDRAHITHTGYASLFCNITVSNVLVVPDFKFNLLSVSKLTKDLSRSVNFFPGFCVFQEFWSGRVKGIGRQRGDLCIYKDADISKQGTQHPITATIQRGDSSLWHNRLGHPSAQVMKSMKLLHDHVNISQLNKCTICPLAKQARLMFPSSDSRADAPFHIEVGNIASLKGVWMSVFSNYNSYRRQVCRKSKASCSYGPDDNSASSLEPNALDSDSFDLELSPSLALENEGGDDINEESTSFDTGHIPSDGVHAPVTRKSSRDSKQPVWMKDYITTKQSTSWTLWQMDVYNAFLQGTLCEQAYMDMLEGFRRQGESRVCRLLKSLYGLKQASRQWNIKLTDALVDAEFVQSSHDYPLFILNNSDDIVIVLVYVNDLLITGSSIELINKAKRVLNHKFKMKTLVN
ncbi:PREDICTED: uncharacterized protein LOC109206876 [Nicotiana attenuata]|uniref:uncharacterized protein LOC109206876 n=1 Tax=Nicotiana attenuata TaxID=49451 RepID=UPI000904FC1E|nr:PREDICTED: uncharacterized protein LOC109206876 [Nicotiana attenuata]